MAVIKIVPMPGAVGDKGDEGAVGPRGLQGEQGLQGPAGADALWSYNGEWQLNSSYATGDVVTYQGQLYYAKAITTAGTLPTDTSKFDLIAAKGADGEPGLNGLEGDQGPQGEPGADGSPGLVYLGDYVSGNGYIANIAVVKGADENLYIAKASGGLLSPVANPGQWDLFLPKGANGADGTDGSNGADALWNFLGEYDGGADYNIGDVVTYYRVLPLNAGYAPGTEYWTTIAAPGADADVSFQSVRWTPNFTATGLTFTGSGATHPTYNSHYVKQGQLVSFWIAVDCSTVTSFGTGQLNLELPFAPLAGTMNHFSGWVFVDETANPDLAGHIIVNADHLPNTQTLDLHYIKQQGGANSPVMEAMLKQNTPVVLTTNTNIYVNGTYISA
jgi:chitodextrinase